MNLGSNVFSKQSVYQNTNCIAGMTAARGRACLANPAKSSSNSKYLTNSKLLRKMHRNTPRTQLFASANVTNATVASDQQQQSLGSISDDQSYPGPLETPRPPTIPWEDVILFQSFGWESSKQGGHHYEIIQSIIPDLIKAGITHVWLPPPSHSVSKEGYLPTQLYDLNSSYGSYQSLVTLTTQLLKAGIRPVADIVINHRCADEKDPKTGIWNKFRDDVPHPGLRIDWDAAAIASTDPDFQGRGNPDTGADFGPSPDLDHENEQVREGIKDWLFWLREYIGFEGWRIDFAKGYSGEVAAYYIKNSLPGGKYFCVAEYWADAAWNGSDLQYNQDGMRQALCDYMDSVGGEVTATFDFTTKAILQEAVKNVQYDRLRDKDNKPPGLIGWWPQRAVTFIDNHDTGSTQRNWPFPSGLNNLCRGYAYILTHPGIPCIFWEHFVAKTSAISESDTNALQKQIIELLALRKRAGVNAASPIKILTAEKDLYIAEINSSLVLKLGPRYDGGDLLPKESDGWVLTLSGKDWAAWERDEKKVLS